MSINGFTYDVGSGMKELPSVVWVVIRHGNMEDGGEAIPRDDVENTKGLEEVVRGNNDGGGDERSTHSKKMSFN